MSTAQKTVEAWQDRWNRPSLKDLLAGLKAHQSRNFEILMALMDEREETEQSIIWYGPSWKWTVRYLWNKGKGEPIQFAYFIANVEQPIICMPMTQAFVETVPVRRLSKFVRESLKSSKQAVDLIWGSWTPGPESEANQLGDLVKRRIKFLAE